MHRNTDHIDKVRKESGLKTLKLDFKWKHCSHWVYYIIVFSFSLHSFLIIGEMEYNNTIPTLISL